MENVRIVLADDQKLFVQSLKTVIEARSENIEVVGIAYNGREAIELVKALCPHIVLMDVRMPVMDGVEATRTICKKYPETQVIMLTTYDDEVYVHDALSKGAVGYLLKETQPSNLIMSLLAVKEGSILISPTIAKKLVKQLDTPVPRSGTSDMTTQTPWLDDLTKREKEVLLLLAKGHNNKMIADELFITEQTVRNHVSMIYSKIGVHDRIEVMLLVNKMNIQ
jgi:DNA-binding NarL/FixJ family response regulator